jgi:hypothetical protein
MIWFWRKMIGDGLRPLHFAAFERLRRSQFGTGYLA